MKILFVCSGNTCRSPMAECIFRKMSDDRNLNVECSGAGIMTCNGLAASENAVKALAEEGLDLSGYSSTSLMSLKLDDYDLFVPMTLNHANALLAYGVDKSKIYLFDTDISDPYGGDMTVYRATRDELSEKLSVLCDFVERKLAG